MFDFPFPADDVILRIGAFYALRPAARRLAVLGCVFLQDLEDPSATTDLGIRLLYLYLDHREVEALYPCLLPPHL